MVRPPSVEGYLDLIRPTSQAKQPVYLSTHENILLILPRARAFPPPPPGTLLTSEATKQMEVDRGAQQILNAYGAGDLRNVVAVRQAFQRLPQFVTEPPAKKGKSKDIDDWANAWAMAEADAGGDGVAAQSEGDEGGDEGLAKAADKGSLVTRRSFELLLVGGNIFRFEVIRLVLAFYIEY